MNQVIVRLLPDKSGRVRIHWFERTDQGPIQTDGVVQPTQAGLVRLGFAKGRISCRPNDTALGGTQGAAYVPTVHSDDVRAVTCPECMATEEFKAMIKSMEDILETTDPTSFNQIQAGKVPAKER